MKKIFALVIVVAMMVVSLASCDLINKVLGKDEKETRTTITKEEWEALFKEMNYTSEATSTTTMTYGEESDTSTNTTLTKSTADAMYDKTVGSYPYNDETYEYEYYYFTKDGVKYELRKYANEDTWYASKYEWEPGGLLEGLGDPEEVTFDKLVYNEETKTYVYKFEESGMVIDYTFYFEDGKLVKVTLVGGGEVDYGNGTMVNLEATGTIIFTNIGTTTIELPEYISDDVSSQD